MTDEAYQYDDEFENLLDQIASKHEVDSEFIRDLIEYESSRVHLNRRPGAKEQIRRMIENHIEETNP